MLVGVSAVDFVVVFSVDENVEVVLILMLLMLVSILYPGIVFFLLAYTCYYVYT